MPKTRAQIYSEAMSLSEAEREILADELWRSVDRANGDDGDAAWADEAERRIDCLDAGKVQPIPGQEVMEEVRQVLRRERPRQ